MLEKLHFNITLSVCTVKRTHFQLEMLEIFARVGTDSMRFYGQCHKSSKKGFFNKRLA
jgi:hypothetical protein